MKRKTFSIKIGEREPNTVFLPYVFPEVQPLKAISFGTRVVECEVKTDYLSESVITIGADIAHELKLPFSADIHVFLQDAAIIIGPLIGIFTAGFTESNLRPIGERSLFFANLLTAIAASKAYLFVFGSHQINWKEGTITGYFYNEKRWVQHDVPFPNVVYDRLPNRKTENHRAIARVKTRLQNEYLIPWFNPGFFNKWDIYQCLQHDPQVSLYLPETHLFSGFERVELLLSKYGHVYLKPINGSLGNSIYQVLYSFEYNEYYCRYRDESGNKLRKYRSLEYLINHLLSHLDLSTFIVQQGISLMRVNGNPVDFRIHTNKDHTGEWQVSAIAAKIAGQGSMTTHVNNGGDVKTIEEIFPDTAERNKITARLAEATLLLSRRIDEKIEGYIGEIGFDIGLDKDGSVWLFEANSKPGRSIFDYPKLKESDRLTKELFLEYALHLTEKALFTPEELFQ
ncbi:YheC/YheD family protein [Ectobacillus panaciterrae]|uniref:YheC/YheD family endospore coat-associated protein n=1 Tax=Ectobacillus panaciterrae TaxID=363872 RepID=UPI0004007B31|nr:YheC/YheD family protein [Ectobacillus panaciterrae]